MADWPTVAISLGASAITGGTAYVVARLNNRARRDEEWRTRRIEAANDFAKQFMGAVNSVEYAVGRAGREPDGRGDAQRLVGELPRDLGSISLLLGRDSRARKEAGEAVAQLQRAVAELRRDSWDGAAAALEAARARHGNFEDAALDAVGERRLDM